MLWKPEELFWIASPLVHVVCELPSCVNVCGFRFVVDACGLPSHGLVDVCAPWGSGKEQGSSHHDLSFERRLLVGLFLSPFCVCVGLMSGLLVLSSIFNAFYILP